jgi:hypothetical protein
MAVHLSEREIASLVYGRAHDADSAGHLGNCARCAEKVRVARALDRTADELLTLLDHPVPRIDPRVITAGRKNAASGRAGAAGVPLRQIAAGIALLFVAFGAAAAIPASPIHKFVASVVARLVTHPQRSTAGMETMLKPAASQSGQSSAALAFVPDSTVDIVFSQSQQSGAIRVVFVDSQELRVNSSAASTAFTLGRHQILADNTSSTASFDISVPKRLQHVRILIGRDTVLQRIGDVVRTVGTIDAPLSFTLPLSASGRRPLTSYKIP